MCKQRLQYIVNRTYLWQNPLNPHDIFDVWRRKLQKVRRQFWPGDVLSVGRYRLMEEVVGYVGDGLLLCMCESRASFLSVHNFLGLHKPPTL
jgi:hypothetical protein